jgi:hypothetical protein
MKYVMIALFVFAISFGARPDTASAFACNYFESTKLQRITPGKRAKLCREVHSELKAYQDEVDKLQEAILDIRLGAIADVLRGTEGEVPNLTRIQIDQQPTAIGQWCCSCIPGENCSADFIDVCDPTPDGTCQEGDIRTVCSTGPDEACTPID